jgi:hypothetical protein
LQFPIAGVLFHQGFLYVTYQTGNVSVCADNGARNGRNDSEILGCPTYGRLSRFAVNAADGSLGSEEILGGTMDNTCVQFPNGGIAQVIAADPTGVSEDVLVLFGTGSDPDIIDWGQLGGNPCGE